MSNQGVPKLVIVGDGGVGKTAIIVRYTQNTFTKDYEPTLTDSYETSIMTSNDNVVKIEIDDTAGQEEYKMLKDKYIVEGDIFMIVYAITDKHSITNSEEYIKEIAMFKETSEFPFVLVGNKLDLDANREVQAEEGKSLAKKYGGKWIETSACTGKNVTEAFQLIAKLLINEKQESESGCCYVI